MRRILIMTALAVAGPTVAHAVPCNTVPGLSNRVYLQVGDTQTNLMKRLGRALRDNGAGSVSLVFRTAGSCVNIESIYSRIPIAAGQTMQYVPSIAVNPNWQPSDATLTCEMDDGGRVVDIANSALFNSACTMTPPKPDTVKLTQGPVQAYVMAVPKASPEKAITAEEAYFVFGFGSAGQVAPWDDELQMFIRTTTKSTLLAWAANIGVPGAKWKGVQRDGSPMVVADLQGSTTPEKAIGILGAEVYDGLRDTLTALAFRARGQYAAYYPDSTPTARDKKNVRDGHYTVWSPTVWMDTTDAQGAPTNATARYVIDLIAGHSVTPAPVFDMVALIAAVGLTPDCAMGVTRDNEGGPLRLYQPAESCTCKYESVVAPTTTSCQACTDTCASGVCRNGFCEVR